MSSCAQWEGRTSCKTTSVEFVGTRRSRAKVSTKIEASSARLSNFWSVLDSSVASDVGVASAGRAAVSNEGSVCARRGTGRLASKIPEVNSSNAFRVILMVELARKEREKIERLDERSRREVSPDAIACFYSIHLDRLAIQNKSKKCNYDCAGTAFLNTNRQTKSML